MKDYYKILGLEETASAEEIHERWIELMQKYHPDHGDEGARNEELAKDLNEAYQTLKYSSSRMGYDLERLHQRSVKKFSIKKFIFPVTGLTGLTFLFIFCLVCFLKPQNPPSLKPKPPSSFSKGEFSAISPYEPGPYWEVTKPALKAEKTVRVEEEKVISQPKRQEIKAVTRNREKKVEPSPQRVRSEASVKPSPVSPSKEVNLSTFRPEGSDLPSTRAQAVGLKVHPKPRSSTPPSKAGLHAAERVNRGKSIESSKPKEAPGPNVPVKISDVHPISDPNLSVKALERDPEDKPPSLIATEEEVKRFFTNYIERYNDRDIHGFLSLFSSKAIQNQKDRLEGIRRIYDNFFSQSRILQYHLADLKMEIRQNAVEAEARYQIDQISNNEGEKRIWEGRIQWILVKEEGSLKIGSLNYQHKKLP